MDHVVVILDGLPQLLKGEGVVATSVLQLTSKLGLSNVKNILPRIGKFKLVFMIHDLLASALFCVRARATPFTLVT